MILLTAIFFLFHLPSGEPVYIARDQVVAILPAVGADPRAHTMIIDTGPTNIYLKELPAEVEKALSAGDE